MQFFPFIFIIVICVLAVTLLVVAISLVQVLRQHYKFMKALNEVVDTSQLQLKETMQEVFLRLLTKVELREELIEELALRSSAPTKKSAKRKSESKQLFRGV